MERRELMQALQSFLASLSPEAEQIFMQRYFLAESVQTIARSNLISETKVKVTLLRVRRKLKEYLRKEGLL